MSKLRAACQTIHVISLGLWLGTLVATGVGAAVTFPIMKSLRPTLPDFASYPAEEHWLIAGGQIANRLFLACDAVQFACVLLCVLSLAAMVLLGLPWRNPRVGVRVLTLGLTLAVLCWHLLVLAPRMNHNIRVFWDSARVGDMAQALPAKVAFDADHPVGTATISILAVGVLLSLIAAAWPGREGAEEHADESRPAPVRTGPRLEEPLLARGVR